MVHNSAGKKLKQVIIKISSRAQGDEDEVLKHLELEKQKNLLRTFNSEGFTKGLIIASRGKPWGI